MTSTVSSLPPKSPPTRESVTIGDRSSSSSSWWRRRSSMATDNSDSLPFHSTQFASSVPELTGYQRGSSNQLSQCSLTFDRRYTASLGGRPSAIDTNQERPEARRQLVAHRAVGQCRFSDDDYDEVCSDSSSTAVELRTASNGFANYSTRQDTLSLMSDEYVPADSDATAALHHAVQRLEQSSASPCNPVEVNCCADVVRVGINPFIAASCRGSGWSSMSVCPTRDSASSDDSRLRQRTEPPPLPHPCSVNATSAQDTRQRCGDQLMDSTCSVPSCR